MKPLVWVLMIIFAYRILLLLVARKLKSRIIVPSAFQTPVAPGAKRADRRQHPSTA